MKFRVIPDKQTTKTPEIKNLDSFLATNKDKLEAFYNYASNRSDAVGLAANQCSLNGKRFNMRAAAIMDINTNKWILAVDPRIVKYHGLKREKAEKCLTWIGKTILADRHHFVDVEYYDLDGNLHSLTAKALQGQVWQHEINH